MALLAEPRLEAQELASLRGGVIALYRNLGRRSQSMVQRQLALIETLGLHAASEEEAERLLEIKLLATRMRRQAAGLVVLSLNNPTRRWQ